MIPLPIIPPPPRSFRRRLHKALALTFSGVLLTVASIALDAPAGAMLTASLLTFVAAMGALGLLLQNR